MVAAINSSVSRTVGYLPHEVFFGEPPRHLVPSAVGQPIAISLGEESPETVEQYVRRIRAQVQRIHTTARDIQREYEAGMEQDYAEYPVAGRQYSADQQLARKRPHPVYTRGQLVAVKRMRGAMGQQAHHFAMKAAGPFIVIEDRGEQVLVQGPTGQRKWQHKSNVLELKQALQ